MLRRLYNGTLAMAGSPRAPLALGAVSFAESSFFPVPADILFIPMCAARPDRAMRYAFIASLASILGGIFGWIIGYYAFDLIALPALEFYGKAEEFQAFRANVAGNQWLILFFLVTSGATHLPPMKVVTILSGLVAFSLPLFILAAIVARGGKFYGLAWAIRRWGSAVLTFVERRLTAVVLSLLAAGIALWLGLRLTGA